VRIISVANQKGGTAKTSTAHALVTGAAYKGKRSLAIDFDPQGNLSFIMGADANRAGAYELMKQQAKAAQIVQYTSQGDIIPASLNLAAADTEFSGKPGRDFFLQAALEPLQDDYDVVVIDTPPTLGTLLVNALTASDEVIIPMNADILSLQGLYQLAETINQVKSFCNKGLKVTGILLTRYSGRTVLARDIKETIEAKCAELGIPLLNTVIRDGVAVREAQTTQESLFAYAPNSNPAKDYLQLFDEINL
jgi:chromosome partitioning protein